MVIAGYCLAVASLMVVWWAVSLRRGALSRPDRTVVEVALHLCAEMITALVLALGGALLLAGGSAGVALIGLGMLLYTVIASPGYFLARREFPPVIMFGVLALLTVVAMAMLVAAPD